VENTKFVQELQKQVYHFKVKQNFSEIAILCIGTNKLVGDSLGPIVGEKLKNRLAQKEKIAVYGNMEETLNFKNAKQVLEQVVTIGKTPFIIGIDSALGKQEMVGKIIVGKGKLQIGSALGKKLGYPTHIHIKAVVGTDTKSWQKNIKVLEQIKNKNIYKISNDIVEGVCQILETV